MIWQGEIVAARDILVRLIAKAEYTSELEFDAVLPDRNAVNLAYLTVLEWVLGRPDTALALAERAYGIATTRGDPWAVGLTYNNLSRLRILLGASSAEVRAPALQVLATPLAMVWHGPASLTVAWADAQAGTLGDDAVAGVLAAFQERLARQPMGPSHLVLPILEMLCMLGKVALARPLIAQVLDLCRARNERIFESEVVRIRGEVAEPTDRAGALADYREALACARAIAAPMLELRALNRIVAITDGADRSSARDELAEVVARFTEGATTRDLMTARALLE